MDEMNKIARFILKEFRVEIGASNDKSVSDCAIRLLRRLKNAEEAVLLLQDKMKAYIRAPHNEHAPENYPEQKKKDS